MSIVINIYYKGQNGNAKKFAEEMITSGLVNKIRNEKGNLRYSYFFPMEDEQTVLLIDEWENQEALDRHHQTDMMNSIAKLRDKYDLHMKVEEFIKNDDNPLKNERYIRK